jgi:hypothetical protein
MFLILLIATACASLFPGRILGAAPLHTESIIMGDVGAGKLKKGVITLTNDNSDRKEWSADLDEGWVYKSGQPISGVIENGRMAQVQISMKSSLIPAGGDNNHHGLYTVVVNLEHDNKHVSYQKKLSGGNHREKLILNAGGERKIVELSFCVLEYPPEPVLSVSPRCLDFGTLGQGQKAIKKIEITNRGRQALRWKVHQKNNVQHNAAHDLLTGRYISFFSPDSQGTGQYRPISPGKDHAEFNGYWSEMDGYPEAQPNSVLKYRFSGSGVILSFWKSPSGGKISIYIDNRLMANIDTFNDQTVAAEYRIQESVSNAAHTLMLVNNLGRVVIDGIKITGKEIIRGNGKWIKIFPEIGVTTREIDYLHVSVDTTRLPPGTYGHLMSIESNGGEATIEIFADISAEAAYRILDVYRYRFGNDYLFSTNPEGESRTAYFRNYRKEGIAFRLFSPGGPGTTEFYRWYNPRKQLHFYSYETNGGGKLSREYVFEGTIGNIATSRLPNTRELYRWHHADKGEYFFTTDAKGEGVFKKGYKYDGIAGYVR